MHDFGLFSRDKTELQQELTTVKTFSNDKCITAVFKHGKLTKSQNISLITRQY